MSFRCPFRHWILLLALGAAVGTQAAGAQSSPPRDSLTAEDAVRQALTDNPTVQAVQQGRRAASASVREARRA